jgi:sec-independent protein translocase protein TatA
MTSVNIWELLIIFGIIILLFGGSRLASVGKALGEAIANFKKGINSLDHEAPKSSVPTPSARLSSHTSEEIPHYEQEGQASVEKLEHHRR